MIPVLGLDLEFEVKILNFEVKIPVLRLDLEFEVKILNFEVNSELFG